jgi:CRP-like cAMP-binding protein
MEPVLDPLTGTEPLHEPDRNCLIGLISDVRSFAPRDEIVSADEPVDSSSVLLEGLACREKVLASGLRQITAFHLPGDFCDLHAYMLKTAPDSVQAITRCQVGVVTHDRLDAITSASPRIAHLLWKSILIDAAVNRRWLVCIGRQSALSRLCHLFCEFYCRLRTIGATDKFTCPFPIIQTDLADALGLSLVHINKTCARIRKEGLATLGNGVLTIHDWERLREAAEFDPQYLHLEAHVGFA